MDISFISGQDKFNYRVCAIILSGNKILAMHDERSPYYYLPGGRVRMGEPPKMPLSEKWKRNWKSRQRSFVRYG